MIIRQAKETEIKKIRRMAEEFNLDSEDMPASEFLIAEENNKILGFGRVKKHTDCIELCSLFVKKKTAKRASGQK